MPLNNLVRSSSDLSFMPCTTMIFFRTLHEHGSEPLLYAMCRQMRKCMMSPTDSKKIVGPKTSTHHFSNGVNSIGQTLTPDAGLKWKAMLRIHHQDSLPSISRRVNACIQNVSVCSSEPPVSGKSLPSGNRKHHDVFGIRQHELSLVSSARAVFLSNLSEVTLFTMR
eukprot:COSAG02_NODE_4198_length_5638_cov_3.079437_1_plen_167_part_00